MLRCDFCGNVIQPTDEDNLCEECRRKQKNKKELARERMEKWKQRNHTWKIKARFFKYQKNDIQKGRFFELSFEQSKDIMESNCLYCGRYDNPNGIDRLDSSIGHTLENCVPCCKRCNQMKWDMSIDEFKEHITLIYFHLIEEDDV
jgi:hypothetical protein